jgi:hypothetical protein
MPPFVWILIAKVVEGIALVVASTRYIYDYLINLEILVERKTKRQFLQHLGEWKQICSFVQKV